MNPVILQTPLCYSFRLFNLGEVRERKKKLPPPGSEDDSEEEVVHCVLDRGLSQGGGVGVVVPRPEG